MALRNGLLACGIVAALLYVVTDLVAGALYPDYSLAEQAVSELFAIGAPTSRLVVMRFSRSSLTSLAFACGHWMTKENRRMQMLAATFAGSALVGLLLWNFFPMHMPGEERGLTDTMHLVLATNPFVLLSLAAGVAALAGCFHWYTVATIFLLLIPAAVAFRYAPDVQANRPTPGLGLAERTVQYAYALWQIALAVVVLLRERPGRPLR
jgi:hypothetical membrane protein